MRFALIGHPVKHSLSPKTYKDILGHSLQYDLLDIIDEPNLPSLKELAQTYDGINITTPYKRAYLSDVEFENTEIDKLSAINAISFVDGKFIATNTDFIAVEIILKNYLKAHPQLKIVLLGDGSMAKITKLLLGKFSVPFVQLSRKMGTLTTQTDLTGYVDQNNQTLVINACSRHFIFEGKLDQKFSFWDYNYSYLPDNHPLPSKINSYQDGQSLLILQAEACLEFWKRTNPKLKY